jgi:hypothetical protein
MTYKKNPKGKRGPGLGGSSKNPDGSFKSRLKGKQQQLLKTKVKSRIDQHGAHLTRSTGPASTAATAFELTDPIINAVVIEINSMDCLYCQAGAVCSHPRKNLCFAQDVTLAYESITETTEAIQANKAQKAVDKVNRLRTRQLRLAEAALTEKATRKAARAKQLLAHAVLEEANDWIKKVINHIQ